MYADSFDNIPQTVSVYVLNGMKDEFEAKSQWQTLEQAETDGHKKIALIELDMGIGAGTVYTDATGNRLDDVTLIRDMDGDPLRDFM